MRPGSRIVATLLCCLSFVVGFGSLSSAEPNADQGSFPIPSIENREQQAFRLTRHTAVYRSIFRVDSRPTCENTNMPQPLATPNPVVGVMEARRRIVVNFIVGIDGRVHSPFILDGAGTTQGKDVLHTLRAWRYRPATCNGIPTDAEAKVEFSSR